MFWLALVLWTDGSYSSLQSKGQFPVCFFQIDCKNQYFICGLTEDVQKKPQSFPDILRPFCVWVVNPASSPVIFLFNPSQTTVYPNTWQGRGYQLTQIITFDYLFTKKQNEAIPYLAVKRLIHTSTQLKGFCCFQCSLWITLLSSFPSP